MTLEDLIRDAAAKGNMTHLSIIPAPNGTSWRASFTPAKRMGIAYGEDADPVKAMALAIKHGMKRENLTKTEDDRSDDLDFG